MSSRCRILFVLGCPGSGKSTECSLLAHELGAIHVAAGDLLRAQLGLGTERARLIAELMKDGKLVPSEWTVELILERVQAIASSQSNPLILLDGFPRNKSNMTLWNQTVDSLAPRLSIQTLGILVLECDLVTIEARLLARNQTTGRIDDVIDTIRKRYQSHIDDTEPVIESYEPASSVIRVNGYNTPAIVHDQVLQALIPLLESSDE